MSARPWTALSRWRPAGHGRRRDDLLTALRRAVFPVAAFWLYTVAMGVADAGSAAKRVAAVWIGVLAVLALPRMRGTPSPRLVLHVLVAIAAGLALVRVAGAGAAVAENRVPNVDIGRTTIAAAELVRAGENPYTAYLDPTGRAVDPDGEGFRWFGGFKYGPVMAWAHVPGVVLLGTRGFYVTNLLLLGVAAAAIWHLLRRQVTQVAAVGAVAFFFATSFLGYELFYRGANDILPIALGLLGFALRYRGASVPAGVALGLSIGSKALPGALLFLPLLFVGRQRGRFAAAAVATAAAVHVPPLVESPRELIAGLLVFNLAQDPEPTSILSYLPAVAAPPLSAAATAAAFALPLAWGLRGGRRDVLTTATVAASAIGLFFIGSIQVHRNYLLWVVPLVAIALASRIWARDVSDEGGSGSRGVVGS